MVARRGEGVIRYTLPEVPSDADLLHPYLAPGAALAWHWEGRETLHSGVFATDAGAVLLFGDKESGKSTTLAWLAENLGVTVMADDLAVIDHDQVLAGPRTIDLRSRAIEGGEEGGARVRDGERMRISLPPAPAAAPVVASVVLAWGPRMALTPVPLRERIAVLGAQRSYPMLAPEPRTLLELAARPMLTLTRPQTLDGLAEAARALAERF
jgi:hypothetical protein